MSVNLNGGPVEYDGPLYDSHAHLVSDNDEKYPRSGYPMPKNPDGKRRLPPPWAGGMIGMPGGMHGDNPINEKPTAEQLHQWMVETNVKQIAAVQKGMIYATDNRYIVDAADLFPDAMRAIIIMDPDEDKTLPEIRELSKRGIVGVRYFPVQVEDKIKWFTSERSVAMWALCDELGLIVDIEGPGANCYALIPTMEDLASRYQTPVVMDHLFMPNILEADYGIDERFDGFRKMEHISLKWTSLSMDFIREQGVPVQNVLRRAVDFYGADRIMWGSDIGTSSGTYHEMVRRAIDSTELLTEEERHKVLYQTGMTILGSRGFKN